MFRDLLKGAKRFTDLMERLGGITPRRSASACAS
jgi:DNA-binding HxlR family transcriptional regulator